MGGIRGLLATRGSSGPIAVSRMVLGAAALLRAFVGAPLLVSLGQADALIVPRVEWLRASTPLVRVILVVWAVSAVMFGLGWRFKVAGSALTASIGLVLALDHQTFSNHLYLLALAVFLMTLADAAAKWSIDARRQGVRDEVDVWPARLFQVQISILLGWSVIGKLASDFLSGSQLAAQLGQGLLSFPDFARTPQVMVALSAATLVLEGFLALALWSPRLRTLALVVAAGFHLAILVFMEPADQLLVFALVMTAGYILFATDGFRARSNPTTDLRTSTAQAI